MSARLGELERRVANMIRPGTVVEADYKLARVRVALGKNKTGWLPWSTGRAGGDVTWHAPEVGEQVVVISPSGTMESGFVIAGGVYKEDIPANADSPEISRATFKDGAVYEYDREKHERLIKLPEGKSTVQVRENVVAELTEEKITHRVGDNAKAEITSSSLKLTIGSSSIELTASGISIIGAAVTIQGPVTQTGGNLTSDGIGLQTHKHGGVTSGVQVTATPVP